VVLEEIAGAYDGGITDHKSGCDCLQLSGMRAYEFLLDILPYSVVKRGQMQVFLNTIDAIRAGGTPDVASVVGEISAMKRSRHASAI
jgi:hypothetical protein